MNSCDDKNRVSLIYKYYAPNEYNLDALLNHYFWFSKRECLNDPFDVANFKRGQKVLTFDAELLQNTFLAMGLSEEKAKQRIHEYAICSFTRNELNKQMWAYYAKDYSGWCLAFRRNKLITSDAPSLFPVIYIDDLSKAIAPIAEAKYGDSRLEISIHKVLSMKHKTWIHEEEERMIKRMARENVGNECVWKDDALKHITIGNKINPAYRSIILTLAKKFNVDVYEIDLSQTDFQLTKKLIQSKVNA